MNSALDLKKMVNTFPVLGGAAIGINEIFKKQIGGSIDWLGTLKKKRFLQPNSPKLPSGTKVPYREGSNSELSMSIGGEQGEPAYLIPTFKYGVPLKDPRGEYRKTGEHLGGPFKTWQDLTRSR